MDMVTKISTTYLRYCLMKNSSIIVIEMNHDIQALYNSNRPKLLKQRIKKTHLANEQTTTVFDQLINQEIVAIYLAHISGECNSPKLIKNELARWGMKKDFFPWNMYISRRDRPSALITLSGSDTCKSTMRPLVLSELKARYSPRKDLLSYF